MVRPDQEAIDTFMSIAGVSEAIAVQKLEEHGGNLNEAVNAHFSEVDRNINQEASATVQDDAMDIDDPVPVPVEFRRPSSLISQFPRPAFPLVDPIFTRSVFGTGSDNSSQSPFVSHPREVREIPIEVKDGIEESGGQSRNAPIIEDVTETTHTQGTEQHGTVIIDDDDDEDDLNIPSAPIPQTTPTAPSIYDLPDDYSAIEEEMIRAAIEASKQEAEISIQQHDNHLNRGEPTTRPAQDVDLEHAVSLSLQTAEREKALRELEGNIDVREMEAQKAVPLQEMTEVPSSNGRKSQLEIGSSSVQDEAEDVEELPLIRRSRRRRVSSVPAEQTEDIDDVEVVTPPSPNVQHNGTEFPSEWGGLSSEEHDEAVMLEAAMFGGIPEGPRYNFPYAPQNGSSRGVDPYSRHMRIPEGPGYDFPYGPQTVDDDDLDGVVDPYARRIPRPPSPSLTAQRMIREQQDDEYLASLQADKEKELKAQEEAEAALAEEKRKEEEEQEIERQLTAKEASLPEEPTQDDENSVNLLVRMPDGSRRGRRFRKSDKLQYLFDFIDVGRVVKSGTYRLVRPYPRRAFSDGESTASLSDLGLTSKQEALYLELI